MSGAQGGGAELPHPQNFPPYTEKIISIDVTIEEQHIHMNIDTSTIRDINHHGESDNSTNQQPSAIKKDPFQSEEGSGGR